jgi:plastocyanin
MRVLGAVGAVTLAAAGFGVAGTFTVTLGAGGPQPGTLSVNWGDTVVFANGDSQPHALVSDRAGFTVPSLAPSATYPHTFTDDPGTYVYVERGADQDRVGQVVVDLRGEVRLTSTAPETLGYGSTLPIRGRSTFGGYPAQISFRAAGATSTWRDVLAANVGAAGAFSARVKPDRGGCYRASAAGGRVSSNEVCFELRPRLRILVPVRRMAAGRTLTVAARVQPAGAAARMKLERYDFDRRGWNTVLVRSVPSSGSVIFRWKTASGKALLRTSIGAGDVPAGFDPAVSPWVRITVAPAGRGSG